MLLTSAATFVACRSIRLHRYTWQIQKMTAPLSPKSMPRAVDNSENPFSLSSLRPFHAENDGIPSPLIHDSSSFTMQKQPTAIDLIQDQDVILDPNTPLTPRHRLAEQQMTTGSAGQVLKRHMDAVLKVYCIHCKPNYEIPWQILQQTTSKSTGFAVLDPNGHRCILTNAHSVTYASQVQLKRRADDERFQAKVLAVGSECDIALLSVEDEEFWHGIVPLQLSSELPNLQASVAVLGYPIGGDSLAVSAGVVSRVQMTHYSHGCMSLLAIQTDAAINSGNSGGPVLNDEGHCIGIAFQSLTGDTQSIGYVIPTSVVRHFLEDVSRHGEYTGFPSLNIGWQEMDSKALKRAYGLSPHEKGILVRKVVQAAEEAHKLHVDDVILSIDGVDVGSDGTVPFRHGERVDFKYLITNKFVGESASLVVMRKGERLNVSVQLQPYMHLIPAHNKERKPSFFMVGGLVFTSCNDPYLIQRYGSLGSSPVRLMSKTYYGTKSRPEEEVVVLSNVLVCPATVGYDSTVGIKDSAIHSFNGQRIWGLAQLAKAVNECEEEFMRFTMEAGNKTIVLETKLARECTDDVVEKHNMSACMSRDIKQALKSMEDEE